MTDEVPDMLCSYQSSGHYVIISLTSGFWPPLFLKDDVLRIMTCSFYSGNVSFWLKLNLISSVWRIFFQSNLVFGILGQSLIWSFSLYYECFARCCETTACKFTKCVFDFDNDTPTLFKIASDLTGTSKTVHWCCVTKMDRRLNRVPLRSYQMQKKTSIAFYLLD